jgi:hypothetical protein
MMSQYGARELHAGYARPHARRRMPSFTHSVTRTHALGRAHTYAIFVAFRLQQWFREHSSLLHYTYIVCIVVQYFDRFSEKLF